MIKNFETILSMSMIQDTQKMIHNEFFKNVYTFSQ